MSEMSSSPLFEKILDRICSCGQRQITFAEYMEMCLYDPDYGYYNSRAIAIGTEGDFFTSTSISSDFGELLAKQIKEYWDSLGQPANFQLVEMGAGEGVLSKIILDYCKLKYSNFYQNINYIIIEKSHQLKNRQQQLLNPQIYPIKWLTWLEIDDNSIVGCFFSNELIDALSVHKVVKKSGQLREIYITVENNLLTEKVDQLSTLSIEKYFHENGIDLTDESYPDNYQTEVNLNAIELITKIGQKLKRGYVLTIDYGYNASKYYHPQRYQGTLQCYYQHRYHDNPYVNLGTQDITAHVNFTSLEIAGEKIGLQKIDFTPQALFLMGLGLGDRLNALSDGTMSLDQIWQRRNQLHELMNPHGLGGFSVLIQRKN